METKTTGNSPDFQHLFESAPGLFLVLSPQFIIVAVSDAYLAATMTKRNHIIGRGIFDVFPDNPKNPNATGVANLKASLNKVLQHKAPDAMPAQQYDIQRRKSEGGGFEKRYWKPLNSPVLSPDNEVAYIIHRVEDITETVLLKQKGKEDLSLIEQLKESREKTRLILESAPDPVITVNEDGIITNWNRQAEIIFGWEKAEVIGKPLIQNIIPERYREEHKQEMAFFFKAGEGPFLTTVTEITALRKNKTEFPVEIKISPSQKLNGKYVFIAFIRDITERKKAEDELKTSNDRFMKIFDVNPMAMIITNLETLRLQYVNETFVKTFGYSKDEVIGKKALAFNLVDPAVDKNYLSLVKKEGRVNDIELLVRKKNGEKIWTLSSFQIVSINDQNFVLSSFLDITERKKSEEELKNSSERSFKIFDSNPVGMIISNLETSKVEYVNDSFLKTFGYAKDEPIGKTTLDLKLLDPELRKKLRTKLKSKGKLNDIEILTTKKNGETFWALASFQIITFNNNKYILTSLHNISDRKKTEETIKQTNKFIDSVLDNIPNMIFVKDVKELRFLRFNKAGEKLLGYSHEDLIGKNDYDFFSKQQADFFTAADREVIRKKEIYDIPEEEIDTKSGKRWLHTRKIVITDEKNMPLYLLGISEDITERKKADALILEKSSELEISNQDLEQFAYVASHDLQEPLRTISNFVGLLREKYSGKTDKETEQYLRFITSATAKMQNLIKDLLEFSRVGRNMILKAVDCNELLKEVIADLGATIKESNAKITYTPLPIVKGNETELKRLFQNLISNAIKFRKKNVNPEITISAEEKETETIFSFKDNGIGIEEQHFKKLFIIFQRLQNAVEYPGTGIGLVTAKKIVSLHNGRIWVESKLGEGSTFYFTIPKEPVKSNLKFSNL